MHVLIDEFSKYFENHTLSPAHSLTTKMSHSTPTKGTNHRTDPTWVGTPGTLTRDSAMTLLPKAWAELVAEAEKENKDILEIYNDYVESVGQVRACPHSCMYMVSLSELVLCHSHHNRPPRSNQRLMRNDRWHARKCWLTLAQNDGKLLRA
jgi:hypothetical protein